MRHLQKFQQFGVNEALLTPHYIERVELRIGDLTISDKDGGKYNTHDAVKRIKMLLNKIATETVERKSVTSEKKMTIFDFGDVRIKYEGKVYMPTLTAPMELGGKTTTGSRFAAVVAGNNAVTLMLYPRDAGAPEISALYKRHMAETGMHMKNSQEIDHLYVKDQVNIIDMDMDFDAFVSSLSDDGPKSKQIDRVPKEMVFAPGTKLKYYKDSQVVQKVVARTERVGKGVRVFFDDKTFRTFNPDDLFIVTPAKSTSADQAKSSAIGGADSSDFVGRIKEVGTYSAEKYNKKGAGVGGSADYVRILATSTL